MVDYSKWSNINDDDDDDIIKNDKSNQILKYLKTILIQCDDILNKAIDSKNNNNNNNNNNDDDINYNFILALKQYDKLYDKIVDVRKVENNSNTIEIIKLEIIVILNTITCFTQINDWENSIERCHRILDNNSIYYKFITDVQLLRACYFRAFSYYSRGLTEDLINAKSDAKIILKIINNKNNVISDENKLEYQSFLEKLLSKCHINLTSDQLQGIMFQDKIGNDNTNNNNNIESHSIDIDTGMTLFKSGKKEEAYRYFKNLFESVHQQSSSSNNKLLDVYQAYAVTSYAINKLDEAANAYEAAGHFEKSSMSKLSLFLQAATIHYKNKNYSKSSNAYELVLECTSMRSNIENNNIILDQALSEGESQNKLDMITHIAKAGLGATLVAMEKYKEALEYLVEATEFLENTVLTELKLESSENEFSKSFNNSLSRIQHALNSIESMVDAYIGLDMYSEALIAIKKGINIASKLLTWTDHEIKEKKIKPSDEIKIQIKILKKRKATLLLKQGHSLHCDPNIPIYDSVAYNDELEKIALVWEEAAAEFSFVKDHEKSLSTHKFIANMWTNAADIKPYHMDLNANKELADKAYEAWNNAAKEGTYFAEEKINSNVDKHVILKIRKEVMMALYYSAISALYFNNDVARYNFDLCKTSAEKYGKLLEELNSSSPRKSLEVDQYDYTIFNGDLSYHLAYCYFREREDRKKQKRAFGLAALTYSGQRLFEDADRFILMIKKLCLPPQEDPEEEVRELVKIIESEKSASNKSNITKFPILPSSTTQYKLEENNISWFTFLRRNMKFNKIFINDSGNLDLVMIISSSVFIITICYILYPKIVQLIPQQQNLINKIHDSNNNDL